VWWWPREKTNLNRASHKMQAGWAKATMSPTFTIYPPEVRNPQGRNNIIIIIIPLEVDQHNLMANNLGHEAKARE